MISHHILDDTRRSPNENFDYDYYILMPCTMQSHLKLDHCMPHKAAFHPTKCDVINDVKLFQTLQDIPSHIFDVFQSEVTLQKKVH